jgi:hypothetical protein
MVDDEDYELVSGYTWKYTYNAKDMTGYAHASYYVINEHGVRQRKYIKMHRLILGTPKGMEVDHRDGNGLNNTRANIWNCTHEENLRNRKLIDKSIDYRHWMVS